MRWCIYILTIGLLWPTPIVAQSDEQDDRDTLTTSSLTNYVITHPPDVPVRAMAEWEELQAIAIAWSSQWTDVSRFDLLAQIVQAAKEEVEVIIVCDLVSKARAQLQERGVTDFSRISFQGVGRDLNRIWIRDFGAHTVYSNAVDSMLLVDWMYDADYPVADTASPVVMAEHYSVPLYSTTGREYALRLDGGNFLTDGLGTAFSSDRVLQENSSLAYVRIIAEEFMGIDRYIILPRLPYDVIHHVDMHMKLLDEETILIGRYPEGKGDYMQLEENIQFIQQHYKTPFGKPYKIVRIDMPPDQHGGYPDDANNCSARGKGCYRTYTNALFVNKTILVPTYEEAYDTTALRIWRETMPGYNIVSINCDELIDEFGAIHCITKEIGVNDPLWIVHEKREQACVSDPTYPIPALLKHRSGIKSAKLFYTTNLAYGYQMVDMEQIDEDNWLGEIPAQLFGSTVYYYIQATANSGKEIVRPLPAPRAYWKFPVLSCGTTDVDYLPTKESVQLAVSPNPAREHGLLTLSFTQPLTGSLSVLDMQGKVVENLQAERHFSKGTHTFELPLAAYASGLYIIQFQAAGQRWTEQLVVP